MTPRKITSAIAATAALLLAGCGSDTEPGKSEENTGLKSAEKAQSESKGADTENIGKLGEFVDLGDDVRVRIDTPKVGGDDLGPWLEAPIRVENDSDEATSVPEPSITCADSSETGGYQADSTVRSGDDVPAKSFKEGVFNLLLPSDGRAGEPAKDCTGTAYIEMTSLTSDDVARWEIPADLVAQVNAKNK